MRYYTVQVRYLQAGELKSFLHKEYAQSAADAAIYVAQLMAEPVCIFNVHEHDKFVLPREFVVNAAVIAGE